MQEVWPVVAKATSRWYPVMYGRYVYSFEYPPKHCNVHEIVLH